MKPEQQKLLIDALLPKLRELEFRLKNHKASYWEAKRRFDHIKETGLRATRSVTKREEIRAKNFQEDDSFVRWNEKLSEYELRFSEMWNAIVDAGICDPHTLRGELDNFSKK